MLTPMIAALSIGWATESWDCHAKQKPVGLPVTDTDHKSGCKSIEDCEKKCDDSEDCPDDYDTWIHVQSSDPRRGSILHHRERTR